MNTVFLLMAQGFGATMTLEQVCELLAGKAKQTIRNCVSRGTFPRPTSDGIWLTTDIAAYLESSKSAPTTSNAA